MTPYYDPTFINSVTQSARTMIASFDVNSLYGHVISDIYLDSLFDIKLTKAHYQHFVRLYNRKKYHSPSNIVAAGYTCVTPKWTWEIRPDELVWCEQNLKYGAFIIHSYQFYFAYESDATLFKMRWL